jgi:hypothetical protein
MVEPDKDSTEVAPYVISGIDTRNLVEVAPGVYVIAVGGDCAIGYTGAVEIAIAAGTLGPFVNAFCAELGKRFGGTVADWTSRVYLRRRRDDSKKADLVVEVNNGVTVVELEEGLTDEARLALLDLDIEAEAMRGQRLRWDTTAGVWVPVGKQH